MKILIICNSASGLYDFRSMLINELIHKGYTVSAIIPVSDLEDEISSEKKLENDGVNLIHIPIERRGMNPVQDLKLYKRYNKTIKNVKPDLVITYTIKPNIYGGMVCKKLHIPYAVNITGLGTAFQNDGLLKKLIVFLYKKALKKTKVVFFENEENRQIFINNKITTEKQTCLLNGAGVDLDKFQYMKYPKDNDVTEFLFIGRVMKEKGIEELFTAMQKLYNEKIPCCLNILGGYEENYKDKINAFEKEGWLHYYGYQSDVRPFIEKSNCFVLPSWHEGMANTNLECAASGRPVITSNIHGCLEAVIDNQSGYLCEPKNSDSLYEMMKKFCNISRDQQERMGLIGRKHMVDVFDKEKVVEKTIEKF